MKYNQLGRTGLKVSEICLGTMTWGSQNSETEAHQQLSFAADQGVNFFDTAELYPTTPLSAKTQGRTEEFIGSWLRARGKRADVIIATKITGKGPKWIRGGRGISKSEIHDALDGSLKRLQTDFVDLYQLHWPNRGSYHFRQNWSYDPSSQARDETRQHFEEVLETLAELVRAGKIRHIGLSNETCWGTAQFLEIAANKDLPRVACIQNEYNLMCRLFDLDLAELSHQEDVSLLAYSPLAAGLLSGKYVDGNLPDGSRLSINQDLGGRVVPDIDVVVKAYLDVARRHKIDPCQMALAFCLSRPFMTSVIIGATTMAQLKTNLASRHVALSEEVVSDIDAARRRFPMPF